MQVAKITITTNPLVCSDKEIADTLRRIAASIENGEESGYDYDPELPGIIPGEWNRVVGSGLTNTAPR